MTYVYLRGVESRWWCSAATKVYRCIGSPTACIMRKERASMKQERMEQALHAGVVMSCIEWRRFPKTRFKEAQQSTRCGQILKTAAQQAGHLQLKDPCIVITTFQPSPAGPTSDPTTPCSFPSPTSAQILRSHSATSGPPVTHRAHRRVTAVTPSRRRRDA